MQSFKRAFKIKTTKRYKITCNKTLRSLKKDVGVLKQFQLKL